MNPCFDDSYPGASADVLLEGTRELSDRRGSPRMAPDVITFVITYLFVVFSTLRFSLFSKNTNGSLSVAIGTAATLESWLLRSSSTRNAWS